jgi:hypothetical protein
MSAESDILAALAQYNEGVTSSISSSIATNKLDQVSATVLSKICSFIPFATQAVQIAAGVLKELNNIAGGGPYSEVARIGTDLSQFNIIGIYNDLLNGRTFNTDQYWGAVYYYRYVMGQNVNNQNQISDQMVITALMWFEMKLGVFISGREHLEALQVSAEDYMNLFSVNGDTTIDTTKVNNAVYTMQKYMPKPGFTGAPGLWANTVIGVYDMNLVNMVQGSPSYNAALQADQQTYTATDLLPGQDTPGIPGVQDAEVLGIPVVAFSAIVAIIFIILILLL